ncbi:hypothetical protein Tco_0706455 [Tanacetum coccineum]|uniref:Uncharacterized protein n=1 Tax=Tanacetum coccineum TaxID=301880 RepID=A0ABQ4Y7F1_9ASTR
MKRVKDFVPMESDRSVPKISTGTEEEKELSEEELQKLIMIVLVEEVYVEALQVKYPIIDWEVYSEDTRKYWKIIRVGNDTEAFQTFDDMLKKFNRDDLDKLCSLVKERFSLTDPTDDKERTLWVELKRLFEHDIDDILWKLQRYMHDPLTWRLYDTCGVHHVSTDRGYDIFMLVEKDYPLTRGILTLMLCNKLQMDQYSEMADELLRKITQLSLMEAPQGDPESHGSDPRDEPVLPQVMILGLSHVQRQAFDFLQSLVGMIASVVVYECGDVILNLLRGNNTKDGVDGGTDDSDDGDDDDVVSLIFI